MTKQDRIALSQKGITILRAQWDARKLLWKIVKYNAPTGGWIRFGCRWYISKELCIETVEQICSTEGYKHDS